MNATFDMKTIQVMDIEHGVYNYLKGSINSFNLPTNMDFFEPQEMD